jgi:hypothetical protein
MGLQLPYETDVGPALESTVKNDAAPPPESRNDAAPAPTNFGLPVYV